MLDITDRHCRYFYRLISRKAFLYTEMISDHALIYGNSEQILNYSAFEHPVGLQIGGSNPEILAQAAKRGEQAGYYEINLNVGCPSDRVQKGCFGARLMSDPEQVARCIESMKKQVSCEVTVKCRLGIDHQHVEETLPVFIEKLAKSGCKTFIIHARKAWLKGLSPKNNRTIPELNYKLVREIKQIFPYLEIILNGGLNTIEDAFHEGNGCDGVMMGRAVHKNPWILKQVDHIFFNIKQTEPSLEERLNARWEVLEQYQIYAEKCIQEGVPIRYLLRPLSGLFYGMKGAGIWRKTINDPSVFTKEGMNVFTHALSNMQNF